MDFETEGTKIYKIMKNKFPVGTVEILGFLGEFSKFVKMETFKRKQQ